MTTRSGADVKSDRKEAEIPLWNICAPRSSLLSEHLFLAKSWVKREEGSGRGLPKAPPGIAAAAAAQAAPARPSAGVHLGFTVSGRADRQVIQRTERCSGPEGGSGRTMLQLPHPLCSGSLPARAPVSPGPAVHRRHLLPTAPSASCFCFTVSSLHYLSWNFLSNKPHGFLCLSQVEAWGRCNRRQLCSSLWEAAGLTVKMPKGR